MNLVDRLVAWSLPAVPKPIVGYFSRHYIAGSKTDDAIRVVRELRTEGSMATLDILGEFISRRDQAEEDAKRYLELVRRIEQEQLEDATVSVKLTALGLLIDRGLCLSLMRDLVRVARDAGNFVRIDMEDSSCTDATLEIYQTLRAEFPGSVGIVLQSRLRRTRADVDRLATSDADRLNVRLCKGIYLEPRAIAYTERDIIQRNFTAVLEQLIDHGAYVGIATHDELLVWEALDLIEKRGLDRSQYEFQMLLGVEPELRRILLRAGHPLRVYVPFGEHWYAYSVRRLRENPQIAGHAFRAMFKSNGAT